MTRLGRLLVLTFIESLATVIVERGIYFYFEHHFGFSQAANLGVGLAYGLLYITGALLSHKACQRWGEKPILCAMLIGQALTHVIMLAWVIWPSPGMVVAAMIASGFFYGMKWPVIESYVSAGLTPIGVARAVGRFNAAWSASVPLALWISGPLVEYLPVGLFVLPIIINLVSLALVIPLERHPVHLAANHPDRLPESTLSRYRSQLVSARWSMLSSYSLLFLLAPLMPQLFKGLGYAPAAATALAGLLDLVRFFTFIALERYQGWHGRAWYLVACVFGLILGAALILWGADVGTVVIGEILFGLATGISYYAALYYAMIVKNASVDASGAHEGLIGAGFMLGPIVGLAGIGIGVGRTISATAGITLGAIPLVVVCAVGGLWPLVRVRHRSWQTPAQESDNAR